MDKSENKKRPTEQGAPYQRKPNMIPCKSCGKDVEVYEGDLWAYCNWKCVRAHAKKKATAE